MKTMLWLVKRYKAFLLVMIVNMLLLLAMPEIGVLSFGITKRNLLEMASILPPIFILLGLLDVWVDRDVMMKYMGAGSGIKGGVLAFILGSAAAGPLYAAFPVAAVLLNKGARLFNVFLFIGAWSTTKIPLLLFEASNLGVSFTLLRLGCNLIGIVLIAFLLEKTLAPEERAAIYDRAKDL